MTEPTAATQIDQRLIDLAFPIRTTDRYCDGESRLISYPKVCHAR